MSDVMEKKVRAKFKEMTERTKEDWTIIAEHAMEFNAHLAERVLDHLRLLDGDFGGFPIDRLQHSLQIVTQAHRDGRDEEYADCFCCEQSLNSAHLGGMDICA